MTYDLFSPSTEWSESFCEFEMPDAEVSLYAALFSQTEAKQLFAELRRDIVWRQEQIKLYDQVHAIPRLTAWYGEPNKSYTYSGIKSEPLPWIPALLQIRERIERVSNIRFNSVLLNLYRDGSDSVAWHADDEPELGRNPVIGSVSLGQARAFQMKHKFDKTEKRSIELNSGSYLLMKGATQHNWLHQIAKSQRPLGQRINLTYRVVM